MKYIHEFILNKNNNPGMEGEMYILHDILNRGAEERMDEIETLAELYQGFRDDTLALPVPAFLAKEHLDLINTYNAIHEDIASMTEMNSDPAKTFLRLKRYEEDATGLYYALVNMTDSLIPYANLFTVEDPAVQLIVFNPDLQNP